MNAIPSLATRNAAKLGHTFVRIQCIPGRVRSSLALQFSTEHVIGMELTLHGSTKEMRAFAAELIRHAEAAEAASKEPA